MKELQIVGDDGRVYQLSGSPERMSVASGPEQHPPHPPHPPKPTEPTEPPRPTPGEPAPSPEEIETPPAIPIVNPVSMAGYRTSGAGRPSYSGKHD